MAEFGELTAQWLEGTITYQPNYGGPRGCVPDPETAELAPFLAAANRAGFVTRSSQPGFDGLGFDGAHWQQRAAVDGYVADRDALNRLVNCGRDAGLFVQVGHSSRRTRWNCRVPISRREDKATCWFGVALGRRGIASEHDESPNMAAALQRAAQVTVIDHEWGPTDRMVKFLADFAGSTEQSA